MKVVVLAGGLSPERNVSLSSGVKVAEALRSCGHQVALVDLYFGLTQETEDPEMCYEAPLPEAWRQVAQTAPDLQEVRKARGGVSQFGPGVMELCTAADGVFLALHGACGEDGRIQATFDLMGIPYTGSGYLSSGIAMDKDLTKQLVNMAGIHTPKWAALNYQTADIERLSKELELPCVIKPMDSGSSIGVSIAHDSEQLRVALEVGLSFGGHVIAEQYVTGREIQVGVLEQDALPSIEIIPKKNFYNYENKYQPGAAEEICPAQIPAAVEDALQNTTLKIHRLLGLGVYSRADYILDAAGQPWFLEINTLPGMTPTSLLPQEAAAVGIEYPQLCERILMASMNIRKQG